MSNCKDFKPLGKERCVYEAERTSYTCVCGLKSRNCKIFNPIIESSCANDIEYFFETGGFIKINNVFDDKYRIKFTVGTEYKSDLEKIYDATCCMPSPRGEEDYIIIRVKEVSPFKSYKFKIYCLTYSEKKFRYKTVYYTCTLTGEII